MPHTSLMVVDIETIPDSAHHEGDDFPILPFHQVVAIGFLEANIERSGEGETYTLQHLRCGGETDFSEAQLLDGFFRYFERSKPRLVTYNGRSFDLPVLKYRAMKHGVQAPWLQKGGDRFSNYSYRYSTDWHCDLMDVLADFGASRTVKLDEVSKVMGFPGKFGIDGSQVADYFESGRIQDIRDYCETDVLSTYLVYLRYMLHRADLKKDAYDGAISDVIAMIEAEKGSRPHLGNFMDAWRTQCNGKFTSS